MNNMGNPVSQNSIPITPGYYVGLKTNFGIPEETTAPSLSIKVAAQSSGDGRAAKATAALGGLAPTLSLVPTGPTI